MKIVYNGEKGKAFKDVFSSVIPSMCKNDKRIVYLDADLSSCIGLGGFMKENPNQGINCGIAEANMVGIAAGMSSTGFKPIVHSFGIFASRRCYDQAFLSGGYGGNSVLIMGSDPGVTAAFNGGTHMPFEDMALYRAMPNSVVIDIADAAQLEDLIPKLVELKGVKYLRVPRKDNIKIYEEGSSFTVGKGEIVVENGYDTVIFASGIMVAKALEAAETLKKDGINVTVADMFSVKPLDEKLVLELSSKTKFVLTCENHNKIGGLTSAVSECLIKNNPVKLDYVAVEDEFGEVGPQDYLEERFGLTTEKIVEKIKKGISE